MAATGRAGAAALRLSQSLASLLRRYSEYARYRVCILCIVTLSAICVPTWAAPTQLVMEAPIAIIKIGRDDFLVDFGHVAFGNVELVAPVGTRRTVAVHFGEALSRGRVDRRPPGTVRYKKARVKVRGSAPVIAAPRADRRNTRKGGAGYPPAVRTPADWGTVLPFRWVEVHGWRGELSALQIKRRAAYLSAWDDDAATFESSDDMLNRVWRLSRDTIKATSFAGVYVDGDRERIPYEADAYLNQISHFYTDTDKQMSSDTFDHLMAYPTWPTEWAPHMVFMAYSHWMHTGDRDWLAARYEALKSKLLLQRAGADGLIVSTARQIEKGDIVDWPPGERDGYVFTRVNTVVNAFHLRALQRMVQLAQALGRADDHVFYQRTLRTTAARFQAALFSPDTGLYVDGVQTEHSSLHANLFPLAFGLVPDEHRSALAGWLARRGMACSVYAAQYLLEGLFEHGADAAAVELITAPGDRSWRHMVDSGATITWEAWDMQYKPNQDWNHAWGAAPANLLPRYILGAQPLAPGWSSARIRPMPGNLAYARGRVPTARGPVLIDWQNGATFTFSLALPPGMTARVDLPAAAGSTVVAVEGVPVAAQRRNGRWFLRDAVSGQVVIEVR